jgi:hypothetical protein
MSGDVNTERGRAHVHAQTVENLFDRIDSDKNGFASEAELNVIKQRGGGLNTSEMASVRFMQDYMQTVSGLEKEKDAPKDGQGMGISKADLKTLKVVTDSNKDAKGDAAEADARSHSLNSAWTWLTMPLAGPTVGVYRYFSEKSARNEHYNNAQATVDEAITGGRNDRQRNR